MLYLLVLLLIYLAHLYLKRNHSIWRKQGVQGPAPIPIFGNFAPMVLLKETLPEYLMKLYKQYPDEKVVGLYQGYQPMLLLKDPEIIKQVLIKDFHIFKNRGLTPAKGKINQNLLVAENETWQILRQNLTPVFTSKKIKDMFPLMQKSAENYVNSIEIITTKNKEQELKLLTEKYAIQATTACTFSVNTNPFTTDKNEFYKITRLGLVPTLSTKISLILEIIFPGIRKYIYTNVKSEKAFTNLIMDIIKQKSVVMQKSKDVLDLIINFRNRGKLSSRRDNGISELELDDELLLAQVAIFYFAGVEPTSWLISYILHALSLNQNIQDRLYEEICKVTEKHNSKFTYDAIKDMSYLDMVVNEGLRKYPIVTTLFRKSDADYVIPGSKIFIPKDTMIVISNSALQNDPKYFINPEMFNPENACPENTKSVPQCVDMSFGDGPRNCIGMRFAIIMTKIAVAEFIKTFKVSPSPKTKLQFDHDNFSLLYTSKDGVWLHIAKR